MQYTVSHLSILVCAIANAGTPVHWLSPVDGSWEDPGAWVEGRVPNQSNDDPTLGLTGAYSVRSQSNATYGSLIIENPLAVLQLSNTDHTLLSNIRNSGKIVVGPVIGPGSSTMTLGGFNTISDIGSIELVSHTPNERSRIDAGFSIFTQDIEHSIIGNGELFVTIMTNRGKIEAQGTLGLRLLGSYSQSSTGRIGADSSKLILGDEAVIQGGELYSKGSGEIIIEGNHAEIADLTTNTNLSLNGNKQQLSLRGDIVNNRQYTVDARVNPATKTLYLYADSNVSGEGSIKLYAGSDASEAVLMLEPNRTATLENNILTSGLMWGTPKSLLQFDGQISSIPSLPQPVIQLPMTGPAEIIADQTDITLRTPTTLTDFTLSTIDGGEFVLGPGTVTLNNCVIFSTIRFNKVTSRLELRNTISNYGEIRIDAQSSVSSPVVSSLGGAILSGSGSVELRSGKTVDAILSGGSNTLTIGPDQTVFGYGLISSSSLGGNVVNQGTIRATNPDHPIRLRGNHQGDNGAYIADGAPIQLVTPMLMKSVHFKSIGEGEILMDGSVLESCTLLSGTLRIQHLSSHSTFEGDMVNSGTIRVERETELTLAGNSTLSGLGEIILERGAQLTLGTFSDLDPPVVYGGQTISGAGTVRGTGRLESVSIVADDPDYGITVGGAIDFLNSSLISGDGTIYLHDNSVLSGVQLVGNSIQVGNNVSLSNCDNLAHLKVESRLNLLDANQNNGTIILDGISPSSFTSYLNLDPSGIPLAGTGVINLEHLPDTNLSTLTIRTTVNQTGRIGIGQRVIGAGQIIGRIAIQGELEPNGPQAEFQVTELILESGSKLIATIADSDSTQSSSMITLLPAGSLEVHGTLRIELEPGFLPEPGFRHSIAKSRTHKVPGSISGSFESIELPDSPPGIRYKIDYHDDEIVFLATCTADFNNDFKLNSADIMIFVEALQISDPNSDLNEDGKYDFFDVSLYMHEFSQGCTK